jgi:hypothetical protein
MSTLASTGRSAQNLNFGICIEDITAAIKSSEQIEWTPLKVGAAKTRHPEMSESGGSKDRPRDRIIERPDIPDSAIKNYLEKVQAESKSYIKDLNSTVANLRNDLKEMKSGSSSFPSSVRVPPDAQVVVQRVTTGKGGKRYFFQSASVKDREVGRVDRLVRSVQKNLADARNPDSKLATLALVKSAGPPLDPRNRDEIGFLSDVVVSYPLGEEGVLVSIERNPYVLLLESTTGVYPGSELEPIPVYVAGVLPIPADLNLPVNLTVLIEVPYKDFERVLLGENVPMKNASEQMHSEASDGYREWNDRSGKFSIRAKFIRIDGELVILRKADGKTLNVKLSILSDADQKYVQGQ